ELEPEEPFDRLLDGEDARNGGERKPPPRRRGLQRQRADAREGGGRAEAGVRGEAQSVVPSRLGGRPFRLRLELLDPAERGYRQKSQIAGRCLQMRAYAYSVPPSGVTFYTADYSHGGDPSVH